MFSITFKTKTGFGMKLKAIFISLNGLVHYWKTKQTKNNNNNITDITFKQLGEVKPSFTNQRIFKYTHHPLIVEVRTCIFEIVSQVLTVCKHLQTLQLWKTIMFEFDCDLFRPVAGIQGVPVMNFATQMIITDALSQRRLAEYIQS